MRWQEPQHGVSAVIAVPEAVADPPVYPPRDVVCVIVAEAPEDNPVTVNNLFAPVVEVIATAPELTVGVAHEYAES